MIETIFKGPEHQATHVGTSGLTVTATRTGEQVDVEMELHIPTVQEGQAMIATLLAQLEELQGEDFVAQCIAHYAADTGKQFVQRGDHQAVLIRGRRRGKKA